MTRSGLIPIVLLTTMAAGASAQTVNVTNISMTATASNGNYSTAINGSGTATVTPGGSATVKLTATAYRERGLNCAAADLLQMDMLFTAGADSFTVEATIPNIDKAGAVLSLPLSGSFTMIAGTGAYAGKGGSGSFNITLALVSLAANGDINVSITGGATITLASTLTLAPSISPSGVVPVYSQVTAIQPGSWISIYGKNFATGVTQWNGDFPTALGGVTVTINGKKAYLWFVSPTQINAQAPDDNPTGCVDVTVTNGNGTAKYAVTLLPQQASFSLAGDGKHLVGVIPAPDGSGAYGSGANSYDLMGPVGAFAYKTRPVKRGETLVLYGVGFGPTKAQVAAGQVYNSATPLVNTPIVLLGGQFGPDGNPTTPPVPVAFAGLVGAGLYQFNITVPQNAPTGDVPINVGVFVQGTPLIGDNTAAQSGLVVTIQ
jgi:uncharacterized protein (TIGR03437 family)